ncbi:proteoglycan 4-like [Ambystoma mexicanum]|uniref:proteoglycan 4-like n=1 Tax=Ambystoma mexicanum TaxID=8296 RepID=UPI0037E908B1
MAHAWYSSSPSPFRSVAVDLLNNSVKMPSFMESIDNITTIFQKYASKECGRDKLNKAELTQLLQDELSPAMKVSGDGSIDTILKALDQNGDGQVDFNEFLVLVFKVAKAYNEHVSKSRNLEPCGVHQPGEPQNKPVAGPRAEPATLPAIKPAPEIETEPDLEDKFTQTPDSRVHTVSNTKPAAHPEATCKISPDTKQAQPGPVLATKPAPVLETKPAPVPEKSPPTEPAHVPETKVVPHPEPTYKVSEKEAPVAPAPGTKPASSPETKPAPVPARSTSSGPKTEPAAVPDPKGVPHPAPMCKAPSDAKTEQAQPAPETKAVSAVETPVKPVPEKKATPASVTSKEASPKAATELPTEHAGTWADKTSG